MIERVLLQVFSEYDLRHVKKCSKRNRLGEVDFNKKVIMVKKGQSISDIEVTLLHEIAHVLFEDYLHLDVSEREVDDTAENWHGLTYHSKQGLYLPKGLEKRVNKKLYRGEGNE